MAKEKKRILVTLACKICAEDLEHQVAILDAKGHVWCKRCFGHLA
jgi:hypothetical protein